MNKLNKNPLFQDAHGYSLFQEHHTLNFSSSAGMVLPVLYDILNPGDKIDCDLVLKSRTMPLSGSAYLQLQENVDFFFVPLEQIYHNFGNQYYGIRDFSSDFFSGSDSAVPNFPYTTMERLFTVVDNLPNSYIPYSGYSSLSKSEAFRLLESLGFPVKRMIQIGDTNRNISVFPILLAAYQKICYDYFRDDNRVANEVDAYNFDSLWNATDTTEIGIFSDERLKKLLTLHYVPYQRDFYTNLFVSPVQGQQDIGSYGNDALLKINQWLSGTSTSSTLVPGNVAGIPNASTIAPTTVGMPTAGGATQVTRSQLNYIINPATIRATFAAEKILEVLRRTGKHYDAQTLANFGVNVPNGISGESMFINHFSTSLNIGDVVSTANTDPDGELSPLGEIAGRGWSFDKGRGNKFTAPSHGVLMAVYYSYPKVKYVQSGLDKLNCLVSPSDWYRPQIDNLGMQPLFRYQSMFQDNPTSNAEIVGWQYRFSELKQKFSRVIGNLAGSLNYWSFQKNPVNSQNPSEFYVSPKVLNNLFAVEYTGVMDADTVPFTQQYASIYANDPLYHDIYFNYNKSSKMSAYGLPSL